MEEEKRKTTEEKIHELTAQMVANSKDEAKAREMVAKLGGLYQMDKLIDIPLSDILEVIDFGACVIYKVRDGFVFEAKGGLVTHISYKMQSITTMLQTLFDLHAKEDKTEDENTIYDAFSQSILYCCQCLIFASMNEESLYGIATDILRRFNEYTKDKFDNAEAVPETEEDIKENIEADRLTQGLEILAESPLPPED